MLPRPRYLRCCEPNASLLFDFFKRTLASKVYKGVELSYETVGEKTTEKPPVVILHGLFGSKQNWRTVSKDLAEKTKRQMILTDARNHGASPHTPEMNYDCMVEDVLCLLDKLGLKSACLMGHSMGGKTAMLTALHYPWRVERLIVVDVAPKYSLSGGEIQNYLDVMLGIDLAQVKKKETAELYLREHIKNKVVRTFLLSNLVYCRKTKSYSWRVNLAAIRDNFHRLLDFPHVKGQYDGQTGFVNGMDSSHVLLEDYERILELFPAVYINRLPNAGHWVHADQPREFVKAVDDYFKGRVASPVLQYPEDET